MSEAIEIVKTAVLPLPAIEIAALLGLLSACLVFRLTKVGLIGAYMFAYRWGWIVFMNQSQRFLMGYLVFGCAVGILTVVGMLRSPSEG